MEKAPNIYIKDYYRMTNDLKNRMFNAPNQLNKRANDR